LSNEGSNFPCASVVSPCQAGIAASFVAKVGHAAEAIAKQAETGKFNLLVMGSHGHGNLRNLVMGSVVTAVLAGCKTPLLLVR
jgi:nucleotide-binding universal stress UspA family protein